MATVVSVEDADAATLAEWCRTGTVAQQAAAARHPLTPTADAHALATHAETPVRRALASRSDLTADIALALSMSESSGIRGALARNVNVPIDVIGHLAEDPSAWTAVAILARDDARPSELRAGGAHPDSMARQATAQHPNCPTEVLAALAADPVPGVRDAVAVHPDLPDELAPVLLVNACRSKDPAAIARAAAGWPDDVVAAVVALLPSHHLTSDDELLELAHSVTT